MYKGQNLYCKFRSFYWLYYAFFYLKMVIFAPAYKNYNKIYKWLAIKGLYR